MPATERASHLHIAAVNSPILPGALPANTQWQPLQGAQDGALWTTIAAQSGGPGGTSTPVTLDEYTTDAIVPGTLLSAGLTVSAGIRALDAAGNIDRLRTLASDSDAQVAAQLGLLGAAVRQQLFNGATWDRGRSLASNTDGQAAAQVGLAGVVVRPQIYNGVAYDRQRAPNLFATGVAAAAGNTAVAGGVAGQRIRLMGYMMQISSNVSAAAAAIETVSIFDGAAFTGLSHAFFVPAVALVTGFGMHTTGWIDLSPLGLNFGIANALNINLSIALVTGQAQVTVAFIQAVDP